jgi:chaperonin GroEL (HSP60 family)
MHLPNGCASQEYVIDLSDDLILNNALILVVNEPITHISHIIKTIEFAKSIERPVVIFSPEIKQETLSILIYNKKKLGLNVIFILIYNKKS